jgi:hypothetical protein
MYSYVRDNPLSYTDPTGRRVLLCLDGATQCQDLSDEQYARLYQVQNGQDGVVLPGGKFPNGDVTCSGAKCGTVYYFEAPMESDNGVNMAMVMPFAGGIAGGLAGGAEAVVNETVETATASATKSASTALTPGRANTINHIFGKVGHNLSDLVAKLGSKDAAFDALEDATTKEVVSKGITGQYKVVVSVAGEKVTVTWAVVNGSVRIGSAYIPNP